MTMTYDCYISWNALWVGITLDTFDPVQQNTHTGVKLVWWYGFTPRSTHPEWNVLNAMKLSLRLPENQYIAFQRNCTNQGHPAKEHSCDSIFHLVWSVLRFHKAEGRVESLCLPPYAISQPSSTVMYICYDRCHYRIVFVHPSRLMPNV